MPSNTFYNEILTDHNLHPGHKHDLPDANLVLEGVNPSCGDDIWLKLKVEDGRITDGAFVGDGCAISQASADMMLDLIIGKSEEEAMKRGYPIKISRLPASAIPRARTLQNMDGMLKAIVNTDTEKILGCSLFCVDAPELINLVAFVMKTGQKSSALRNFIFTHPSMSEGLNELFKAF